MILFTSSQVGEVLQRLHDSEINFDLKSDWKQGIGFDLSDGIQIEHVHRKAPHTHDVIGSINTIAAKAVKLYPGSDFAKWYNALEMDAETVAVTQHESQPA